ncbi:rhodanese-like domain-containing protein [Kitasatospora sp. NPDC048296]|uniref:rhodanese-like domain-containing protein n=1 Tax=Kitasatospora sp. NPDC048296 TaxID=3364048 RepID=UPI003717A985
MLKDVDMEAFAAARECGALVLDAREGFEFAMGHVPGARWFRSGYWPTVLPTSHATEPSW